MTLLMFGVYSQRASAKFTSTAAIVLLLIVGAMVAWLVPAKAVTFGGSFVIDTFARVMKILALIGSAAAIALSRRHFASEKQARVEYPILILLSPVGVRLLAAAADLRTP